MSVSVLTLGQCLRLGMTYQWRIKDFPNGGVPTPKLGLFCNLFCRKLHENEGTWTLGVHVPGNPPLDPPMLMLGVDCTG